LSFRNQPADPWILDLGISGGFTDTIYIQNVTQCLKPG
jgi:hypothetical protein